MCFINISCATWCNRSNFDLNCQLISSSHNGTPMVVWVVVLQFSENLERVI